MCIIILATISTTQENK
ncbi:hypothetical protein [Escherichia coli]|nr:hypothetical protein [Escherichia coli]